MKKVFLLMVAGSFAMAANAQELQNRSIMFHSGAQKNQTVSHTANKTDRPIDVTATNHRSAEKTTLMGGGRWYSYGGYLTNQLGSGNWNTSYLPLWNDTTSIDVYSNGTGGYVSEWNEWTSDGMGFDPMYSGFNDISLYGGEIKVTATDAYTVDSLGIYGAYNRSASSLTTATDQMIFGLVYGDGTSTSNLPGYYFSGMTADYGVNNVNFLALLHDSTNNRAMAGSAGPAPVVTTITLHATDTFNGYKAFPITHLVVPPGKVAAASVSFKNSSAAYPLHDTVQHYDGTLGYNEFYSMIIYDYSTSAAAAAFPPYDSLNFQCGHFKREGVNDGGWGGMYIPNWAWTAGGGASDLQYPGVDFHIICATCYPLGISNINKDVVTGIKAYPNPSDNVLNISFNLSKNSDVTVVLTNMVGQVVATQQINGVTDGKATFNTTAIPAGMYVFNLQTNTGLRGTGSIVVAH